MFELSQIACAMYKIRKHWETIFLSFQSYKMHVPKEEDGQHEDLEQMEFGDQLGVVEMIFVMMVLNNLALLSSFPDVPNRVRVRPHQDEEAHRSLSMVVGLVMLWMEEEERVFHL